MTDLIELDASTGPAATPSRSATSIWLSWAGVVAGGFTALCCVGVSAAVSLASALGATFMTRDNALRPLLALSLIVTVTGSGLAYWRHRHASRLVVTVAAALWVYAFIYLAGGNHGGGHADHMADHMVHHAGTSFSGGRLTAIGIGLAALVVAQMWDLIDIRLVRRRNVSAD